MFLRFLSRSTYVPGLLAGLLAFSISGCQTTPDASGTTSVAPAQKETPVTQKDEKPVLAPAVAEAKRADTPVDADLVAADNDFGFRFLGKLTAKEASSNIFVSPSSVALALQVVYNGAKGETQKAMAQTLGLKEMSVEKMNQANAALSASLTDPDPKVQLSIANSLWLKPDFKVNPDFQKADQQYYGAEIGQLTGAAPVNAWVSKQTHDRIKEIVNDPQVQSSVAIIVNAIYFKGLWSHPFETSATKEENFTTLDGKSQTVKMMHQSGDYAYLKGDGFQAVRLPYGSERLYMVVLLPEKGKDYPAFLGKLTAENWKAWKSQFKETPGDIGLPRFRLEYRTELGDTLKAMGMGVAFTGKADLTGIAPQIAIDQVIHKTFLEVTEEGTEAAAATAITLAPTSVAPTPRERFQMVVDRPFVCAIVDGKTDGILFVGSIVAPGS